MTKFWINRLAISLLSSVTMFALIGCQSPVALSTGTSASLTERALSTSIPAPQSDSAHGWNWADSSWYTSRQLGNPFAKNSYWGINLDDANLCPPAEGWVLYTRRITKGDFSPTVAPSSPQSVAVGQRLFFSLYNTRTGTLRTFFWFERSDIATSYLSIDVVIGNGNGEQKKDSHFFDIDQNGLTYTIEETEGKQLGKRSLTGTGGQLSWLVVDTDLAYDTDYYSKTESQRNYTFLTYTIRRIAESDVKLVGNWSVITGYEKQTVKQGLFDSLANLLSGSASTYNSASTNLAGWADAMAGNTGTGVLDTDLRNAGKLLKEKIGLLDASHWIGSGIAAFVAIPDFLNIMANSGSTETRLIPTMEKAQLTGTITLASSENPYYIPLPGWKPYIDDMPYFIKANPNGKIGLMSFKSRPIGSVALAYSIPPSLPGSWEAQNGMPYRVALRTIQVGSPPFGTVTYLMGYDILNVSQKIKFKNGVRDLIQLNPDSNLELVDVQYAPSYNRKVYVTEQGSPERKEIVDPLVSGTSDYLTTVVSSTVSPLFRQIGTFAGYDPVEFSRFDTSTNPRVRLYIQVRDKTNPAIKAEYVKTIRVNAIVGYQF